MCSLNYHLMFISLTAHSNDSSCGLESESYASSRINPSVCHFLCKLCWWPSINQLKGAFSHFKFNSTWLNPWKFRDTQFMQLRKICMKRSRIILMRWKYRWFHFADIQFYWCFNTPQLKLISPRLREIKPTSCYSEKTLLASCYEQQRNSESLWLA